MKKSTFEKWILLEQAGELSARRRRILAARRAADPGLANYQNELGQLSALVREDTAPEPDPRVLSDLHREVRLQAGRQRRKGPGFFSLWQQAGAYAMLAVMLAAATWYLTRNWEESPSSFAAQPAETSLEPDWLTPIDSALDQITVELASAVNTSTDLPEENGLYSFEELNAMAIALLDSRG